MLFQRRQPPFLSVWALRRTGCKWTVPGSLKLCRFEHVGLSCLGCHAGKVQLKPKTTDEVESHPADHLGRAAMRTLQQGGGKLHRVLDYTWLWLQMVVTLIICSNSVHLQVCTLISSSTNQLLSEPPTEYWEDNAQNAEKWVLTWLKRPNFVIFRWILKVGGKVYILLCNSCVNFMQKSECIADI